MVPSILLYPPFYRYLYYTPLMQTQYVKVQVLTKIIRMGCLGLHCVPSTLLPNSYVEILTPSTSECHVINRVAADVISESEFTLDRVGLNAIWLVSLYKVETWTQVHRP